MIVPGSLETTEDQSSRINRYTYRLRKQDTAPGTSFLESQIGVGEPIVISDEAGHFALAKGYVTSITPTDVVVGVDRRLHNARTRKKGFHPTKNQVFSGIMELLETGEVKSQVQFSTQDSRITYRLDKDEFANGMAMIRNNLIELLNKDTGVRLRELLIDLEAPTFKNQSTAYNLPSASQVNINPDQRRAIDKVMSANDYALVLGMPGTGKTTTIAHIIRALVSQGKSVLLTSYTHTAVDNILLKIKDDDIKILRLGVPSKIHRDIQQSVDTEKTVYKDFEDVRKALLEPQVVATTCLKISHAIFQERVFDYCIVDEASQITLPVCIGPLRMAKTFVLVGDHFQLPPLVKNPEAKVGGLDVSLFKLLSEAHPDSVVNLEHQYRMCEEIMTISNTLIYNGQLKCGTEAVAQKSLKVGNFDALDSLHKVPVFPGRSAICDVTLPCWIKELFDES